MKCIHRHQPLVSWGKLLYYLASSSKIQQNISISESKKYDQCSLKKEESKSKNSLKKEVFRSVIFLPLHEAEKENLVAIKIIKIFSHWPLKETRT